MDVSFFWKKKKRKNNTNPRSIFKNWYLYLSAAEFLLVFLLQFNIHDHCIVNEQLEVGYRL